MTAISIEQLLILARAYSDTTGLALTGVGQRACGNNKVFIRLAEGHGANVLTMARAAEWFSANWPVGRAWPKGVPGKPPTPAPDLPPPQKRQRGGSSTAAA